MRAALEDDDLVGVGDGGHALGDDHHGRVAGVRSQRGPQPRVGREVERRERVVEQVDLRLDHQRPGDAQPLALAAGDVGAALGDRRLQALRHGLDEVAGLGDLERVPQLLVGRVRVAVPEVARDRAGEQVGLLRHQADPAPQHLGGEVADVDAVDPHAARRSRRTSRGISDIRVVLPAPVLPMIAVVWPGCAVSETPGEHRTGGAGIGEADVDQLELAAQRDLLHGRRPLARPRTRCRAPHRSARRRRRRAGS